MNLELRDLIVHNICKAQDEKGNTHFEMELSSHPIDDDEGARHLLEKLTTSYNRKSVDYAEFSEDNPSFARGLMPGLANADPFVTFTQKATVDLRDLIQAKPNARGGYLVFFHYHRHGDPEAPADVAPVRPRHFFAVFLIRNTAGMIFKKNRQDGSFHINALEHLDLNKLALACRIDLDDYQKAEGRYISFMSKQGDVSAYFTQWVGARSVGSDRVLTEDFNRLIERVPLPIREDGTEMTRAEFKQQVYRHVQNHPNKAIDLQLIGQTFYDDSQFLVTQADAGDFAISTHFKANRPALSRLIWGTVDYSRLSDLLGKLETKGQLTYRIHENRERVTFESPELVELLEAIRRGD